MNPPVPEAAATKGLRRLAAAFALAWLASAMAVGPGSAAFVTLTGRNETAGIYLAIYALAAGVGSAVGGRAMDRWGMRRVLVAGHLGIATGFVLAGLGFGARALVPFAAGVALLALGFGIVGLTRLVAAELFGPERRGRAVAVVQSSAIFGAVLGPLLLVGSEPLGRLAGWEPASLVWFIAPPLLLVSSALAHNTPEPARSATGEPPRGPRLLKLPGRPLVVAVLAMAAAEAGMIAVMSVTGAALVHTGHGVGTVGVVMSLHFVGMFGFSLGVGRFTDRYGRRLALMVGLPVLALGGITVTLLPGAIGHAAGLGLIGLGWSFAYLAGTVLVTDVTPPARRARTLGLVDLTTRIIVAATATLSGWAYASRGVAFLGICAAALVVIPFVLALLMREARPGLHEPVQDPLTAPTPPSP